MGSVHPHVCGERSFGLYTPCISSGSSPRVWGTAGEGTLIQRDPQVHPHVCGERFGHRGQFG